MSEKALQPERLEQRHTDRPNLFVALLIHIQRFLNFIRNDKRPVRRELPFATHFSFIINRHDAEHGKILGQPLSGLQSVAKHYNCVIFLLPSLRRPVSCRGQFSDNYCAEGTVCYPLCVM